MSVRNCKEIGPNMQKIVSRLMANDNLVNLLYYSDKDPLSKPGLTDEEKKKEIYNKRIKIVPRLSPQETSQSTISVVAAEGKKYNDNSEFQEVGINIEIFVPITQWIIKNENLRPYAIMGEIQSSLEGKIIDGFGKMIGGDFEYNFGTDEMTAFIQIFKVTQYD